MARPYVTGPAHLWVGFYEESRYDPNGDAGQSSSPSDDPVHKFGTLHSLRPTPQYLGTCQRSPLIDIDNGYLPVYSSDSGPKRPWQHSFQGDAALIVAALNRFNESVYEAMASKTPDEDDTLRGHWHAEDVGRLNLSEQFAAFMLWVVFPYNDVGYLPGGADPAFPPCYRFPQAFLFNPDKLANLDTTGRLTTLAMLAQAERLAPGEAPPGFDVGDWILYDHQMLGCPVFPPN